jgi:hypothetical protein
MPDNQVEAEVGLGRVELPTSRLSGELFGGRDRQSTTPGLLWVQQKLLDVMVTFLGKHLKS